jgi:hypothetical protein
MRRNSGGGDAENNNLDPTLDEQTGSKGPAQRSATLEQQEGAAPKAPSDTRGGRK